MERPEQTAYRRPECHVRAILYDAGLATSSATPEGSLEPFDDWGDYNW